jgi:hypothetical protein
VFLIQTFYHGLKCASCEHLDAAAGGAFFSLQVPPSRNWSRRWWQIKVGMETISNSYPRCTPS